MSFHFPNGKSGESSDASRRALGGPKNRYSIKLRSGKPPPKGRSSTRGLLGTLVHKIFKVIIMKIIENPVGAITYWGVDTWEKNNRIDGQFCGGNIDSVLMERPATFTDFASLRGKKTLLFIHGTTSSTQGAFGALSKADGFLAKVKSTYGNRVIAFNHHTLCRGVADNVVQFYAKLPPGDYPVDIIAHSRGGLLARSLKELSTGIIAQLSCTRNWQPPSGVNLNIDQLILVGTPNEGTDLARPENISGFLNWSATLMNILPEFLGTMAIGAVLSIAAMIAKESTKRLPGLSDQAPGSSLLSNLNQSSLSANKYRAINSNYQINGNLMAALEDTVIQQLFDNKPNDLIVPSNSVVDVGKFHLGSEDIQAFTPAEGVQHTTYFSQKGTWEKVSGWLGIQ